MQDYKYALFHYLYGILYELVEKQIVFVIGIHITEIHSFFLFMIFR